MFEHFHWTVEDVIPIDAVKCTIDSHKVFSQPDDFL